MFGQSHLDPRVQSDDALRVSQVGLVQGSKDHVFTLAIGHHQCDEVTAHHGILRRTHDRTPIGRGKDIVGGHHQGVCLDLCLDRKRQVDGHLVTVKIGVEAFADQGVQVDGIAFHENRFERLNTHAV